MNGYISCDFFKGPLFYVPERVLLDGRLYELDESALGRGGNGVVFRCSDAASGEEFAIKFVNTFYDNVKSRFDRECKNMELCKDHDHILNIYGYGECEVKRSIGRARDFKTVDDKLSWCLMELAEDGNLSEFVEQNPLPKFSMYSAHIRGLASALEYMHDNNVLHRDIKPENILISGERWLLGDFGLTAPIEREGEDLTRIADKIGPRFWMSPEAMNKALGCIGGKIEICTQSDVFQLASVFWFVINSAHPLGVLEQADYCGKIELLDVLLSSLKHNADARPANGKDFHERLSLAIEA